MGSIQQAQETAMKIAIYSRVSTDRQDTTNQVVDLREFAQRQGWDIVLEFVDVVTGGTSNRPQFQAMLEAAERKEFDLLLFWSLDRLSREGTLKTLQHLDRLDKAGVNYRSFTEQHIDSAGFMKDVMLAMLSTMAKQEKVRISERTRAGLATARARGSRLGRPTVSVNVSRLQQLKAEGRTQREISKLTGIPQATVSRRLTVLEAA
jgi:DNA invertase Pin-like site-specific DNA recombinase